MSSNLKVNSIVPATGTNVAIGTAGGTITYGASVTGVSTFSSGLIVSSGSVGINTSSISGFNGACDDIVVSGGSDVGMTFYSTSTTGSGNIAFTDTVGSNTHGAINYSHSGDYMIFQTSASERMRIDSSGRVTKPYQPTFMVYADGGVSYSTSWQRMQFSSSYSGVSFNKSNFDFTNHRYTVPVAGKYLFSAALTFTGSTNTDGTITLAKNGSTDGGRSQSWASGTGLGGVDATYVLDMAANDYCDVRVYFSSSNTTRNTQFAGYFSGFLIG